MLDNSPALAALNLRQQEFVRQYLLSFNATDAAKRAGYTEKSAHVTGAKLLKIAKVQQAIEEAQRQRQEEYKITEKEILDGLARIAFLNPMDLVRWDENTNSWVYRKEILPSFLQGADFWISAEYTKKEDKEQGIMKANLNFRSGDRKGALELLGKHYGLWNERKDGNNQDARKNVLERLNKFLAKPRRDRSGSGSGDAAS